MMKGKPLCFFAVSIILATFVVDENEQWLYNQCARPLNGLKSAAGDGYSELYPRLVLCGVEGADGACHR